jgi:hypothetical protein
MEMGFYWGIGMEVSLMFWEHVGSRKIGTSFEFNIGISVIF